MAQPQVGSPMRDDITIRMVTGGRDTDITKFVQSVAWGGGYNQRARTLTMPVLCANYGVGQQPPDCPLGADILFYTRETLRFCGKVRDRYLDTSSNIRELSCVDPGFYLGNQVSRRYKSITPEALTETLCREFGIRVGNLARTGVRFSRNFVGVDIYKIIQTAYTLAPRTKESKYVTRFRGMELEVVEKTPGPSTLVLRPGSNLISARVKDSIESLVTQVEIRNNSGTVVGMVKNAELQALYGVIQTSIAQVTGKNARVEAQRVLDDNTESQTITVEGLGSPDTISGDCVILQEPLSGQKGLFWVDADNHYWAKDGSYTNKLTLNFRNLMDTAQAGTE